MAAIGYARVPKCERAAGYKEALRKRLGVETIIVDGTTGVRSKLFKLLELVEEGDTIIVESIEEVFLDANDFADIIAYLQMSGIRFISKADKIDTSSENNENISISELCVRLAKRMPLSYKRNLPYTLTQQTSKQKNVMSGRPKKQIDEASFEKSIEEVLQGKRSGAEVAKAFNISTATFSRRKSEYLSKYRHHNSLSE